MIMTVVIHVGVSTTPPDMIQKTAVIAQVPLATAVTEGVPTGETKDLGPANTSTWTDPPRVRLAVAGLDRN